MIKGIDLSSYNNYNQQSILQTIWTQQLYFAFIKASEGVTLQDPKFEVNWNICRKAGMVCGAYHFLRPLTDPAQQVYNFVNQYKKVNTAGVLPPVVDIEWAVGASNKTDQWTIIPATQRIPKIKTFLSGIEEQLHVKPIIYTAFVFWRDIIVTQMTGNDNAYFAQYPLWLVDLKGTGSVPAPWTKALFIQNHFGESSTNRNDIYENTDHDYFNGILKDLLNTTNPGYTIFRGFPKSMIVSDIQKSLAAKKFYASTVDGDFGKNTEQAVKDFQNSAGLVPNGIVDVQTWNKLLI